MASLIPRFAGGIDYCHNSGNVEPSNDLESTPVRSATVPRRLPFSDRQDGCNAGNPGVINTPVPSRFIAGSWRKYTYRNRKPAPPKHLSNLRQKRLTKAKSSENPFEKGRKCCKRYSCFDHVDKVHAFRWYRDLMAMEREEYKASLLSWYNPVRERFEFDGRPVCWRFMSKAFGFSNDLLSAVRGTPGARAAQTAFAQPRENRAPTIRDSVKIFLMITAEACGDNLPNRKAVNLPFSTREQLYEEYLRYFEKQDPLRFTSTPATLPYFYSTWKNHVSWVKTLKNSGFEKCADCVFYDEQRAKHIQNPVALRLISEESKQHYSFMAAERQDYEMRRQISCRDPHHYLSLVVDGADQSNYGLPHFVRKSKDDRGHKIAVKLVGVLIHGTENDFHLFTMVEGFETGANHIIESLHRSLGARKEKVGKLPPVLYVQSDNCTRENKNRFLLSYLEMLVSRGVFVEVQLSSLEVGHTHTDIDQSFSRVHTRLNHNDAFCLNQLHEQLRKSYAPAPRVEELTKVANFSTQCKRQKCLAMVSGFTQYRYFRFLRSSDQARDRFYPTKCQVKKRAHDEWETLQTSDPNCVGFLKCVPDLLELPQTKTKIPPNVRQVNECLKAAEARIRDTEVLTRLNNLRDRVYEARVLDGHWTENCFELNGEYRPNAPRAEVSQISAVFDTNNASEQGNLQRFSYEVGDFVAVKPGSQYHAPFWIAKVMGFGDLDGHGYPSILSVRWYVAGAGNDPLNVIYKPGFDGKQPWVAQIEVETIMLRFGGLTVRSRLSKMTAKKLSRLGADMDSS